jgi:hypothetical protein
MNKTAKVSILAVIGIITVFFFHETACANSIVLRVVAANPSNEHSQIVPVRAYLPKEAQPEDIIDQGGLDIAYDTQQGSYYVFGEYELKPQEVREWEIEIRNIWVIDTAEIESLRQETAKAYEMLRGTEFADRITFLKNSIESKLNEISQRQEDTPANPQQSISDYRNNLKILESVKADLALVRGLLTQAKPFDWRVTWKVIFGIIVFLGLLGLSFYFIWYKQLKAITREDSSFYIPKEEPDSSGAEDKKGQSAEKTREGGQDNSPQ